MTEKVFFDLGKPFSFTDSNAVLINDSAILRGSSKCVNPPNCIILDN